MKNTIITLASVATLAVSANAQTITNGDFGSGLAGWTTTGTPDTNGVHRTAVASANSPDPISPGNWIMFHGTPNVQNSEDETLTNTITGLTSGTTYTLSFFSSNFGYPGRESDSHIRSYVDGVQVDHLTRQLTASTWFQESRDFVASGPTATITFAMIHDEVGGYGYMGIDGVTETVPEPSSTALLGLGGLALLLRRKK